MRKKLTKTSNKDVTTPKETNVNVSRGFQLEFLTPNQKLAWEAFQDNDILFLVGPAGTGKSLLASAFGICEVLKKNKEKLVLTRPIVEAGEKLGYLPGSFEEKVNPYMMPLYDSMDKICGKVGPQREHIQNNVEVAPIAFMRGRTFENSVFIVDEAQNCSYAQLKLAITRIGKNTKMIITGDPDQSDLYGDVALSNLLLKLRGVDGVGIIMFDNQDIVRHPILEKILAKI